MPNTRLGLQNHLAGGTVANGTGGGPARSEVAPYVMDRILLGDRRALWVAGAANQDTGTTWEIVFNLGSSKSFSIATLHAVEGVGISAIEVGHYTSYPATKAVLGNLIQNGRDWGLSFGSVSGQYPYLKVSGSDLVSVGGGFVGPGVDLGVIGLPDFDTHPFRIRSEQPQVDGSVVFNDLDRLGHDFQMAFYAKTVAALAPYEALKDQVGTFVLIDERDRCFEVFLREGRVAIRRRHTGYSITLSMARMP